MNNIQQSNPAELEALRQKLQEVYREASNTDGLECHLIAAILAVTLGASYAGPESLVSMSMVLKRFNQSEITRIQSALN